MNKLVSPHSWNLNTGIFLIRIVIGYFLIIHGKEVFDAAKMQEYVKWDTFKTSSVLPYLGKAAEFAAGVLMLLGLFTRVAAVITIGTFLYITFMVGKGKFWMEDQHPFMFVLFGVLFLFTGPGALSLDKWIYRHTKK